MTLRQRLLTAVTVGAMAAGSVAITGAGSDAVAAEPKRGGILNFVVGSKIPSYDAHRESTFGMIHPIRPFYSTLIRVNPDNPGDPTDLVCDVCTEWSVSDDGLKYTFTLRDDVSFHNGDKMTSADVKESLRIVMFPDESNKEISIRRAFFSMVDNIEAPDATTIVINLKHASGAFLPALAMPFNWIYSAKIIKEKGADWHKTNVMGTGPFVFDEHQSGSFVSGKRNENYFLEGQPYLDGFKALAAPKLATRLNAIRGGRALIEFRGFPPKARDDLVKALGDKINVQESDWNCVLGVVYNHKNPKFQDARVRKALTLAVDRWGGSKYLSKIAIVKTVGGIVYPSHPHAATEEELVKLPGYGKDINASREEAKKLLKEAGAENLTFTLSNRGVDQPYKVVGTWLIDQWSKIGLKVEQKVMPTGPYFAALRQSKDFEAAIDFNCQSIVNPLTDIAKFISADSTSNNYGQWNDPKADDYFNRINKEADPAKQRALIREFEAYVLGEQAYTMISLWWYRIVPHHTSVKGWKISPSHYLNQDLANIWIEE